MPQRQIPQVIDDRLTPLDPAGSSLPAIIVGSAAWAVWLADGTSRSFGYHSPAGSFTARREQRHGRWYWYAYRTHARQLHKVYIGPPEDLTLARLHAGAIRLAMAGSQGEPATSTSLETPVPTPTDPPPAPLAQLLATKRYLPPARADLVRRPRLLDRLNAGPDMLLTLIAAPAGSGKTTLLVDWLRDHPEQPRRAVAWLSLDTGDNDPRTFLRYLIAALQTLAPAIGVTTLGLLQLAQLPPVEILLPTLMNDLATLPHASLLVLDDYQSITAPAIHQALRFLLEHLPPTLHLVIATREDPPLPLARLRARGQICELRAADLRFTLQEGASFLTACMHLRLTADELAALDARTEGWIAGLQLAALAMQNHADHHGFIAAFTGSHRFVVDYLVEEVFDRLPAHLQTFVLQTTILDRLCGPLCDTILLGVERSADSAAQAYSQLMLEELERTNLFLIPLDNERRWYRYHHLFAEVLRARLCSGASASDVKTLYQRASAWYEDAGLMSEAVHYAFLGHDLARIASLIEQHALTMILGRSDVLVVRDWLERLPQSLILTQPRLALVAGWVMVFTGQLAAAERLLANAAPILGAPDLARTIVGELAALRSTMARFQGDAAGTQAYAQEALAQLDPDNHRFRAGATLNMGVAFIWLGDRVAAMAALAEAAVLGELGGSQWIALAAREELSSLQLRHGQLRQTLHTCEQAVQSATRLAGPLLPAAGMAYVGIGEVLYEWNDLAGAMHALTRGVELLRGSVERGLLIRGAIAVAHVHQAREDTDGALDSLRHAEEWVAQTQLYAPVVMAFLAAYRARLGVRQGNLRAAVDWAAACVPTDDRELDAVQQLTLVRLRLAQSHNDPGDPFLGDARRILERVLPALQSQGWTRYLIDCLMHQALVRRAQGDRASALTALNRALSLAEPEGYVRIFVDEGAPIAALLAQVVADALPAVEYATRLLAAFPAKDQETRWHGDAEITQTRDRAVSVSPDRAVCLSMVEPLSDREIEILHLIAAGHSNQAIAETLVIALSTVKKHINNLYGKLAAQSRTQALLRARELKLL